MRYDSQRGFHGGERRGLFRPRTLIYAGLAEAVFHLQAAATGGDPAELVLATPTLRVGAMSDVTTTLIARMPRRDWSTPVPITVTVADSASGTGRAVELTFRGP